MQHNTLGPRTLRLSLYRHVVYIHWFHPCEAIEKGERCKGRQTVRIMDLLEVYRGVCSLHSDDKNVCLPVVLPMEKVTSLPIFVEEECRPRNLAPLVYPTRPKGPKAKERIFSYAAMY
jgi:hypothetical protein